MREYALIFHTLGRSTMASVELGFRPDENPDSLVRKMGTSMENLRFVQQNNAELSRKIDALADEMVWWIASFGETWHLL